MKRFKTIVDAYNFLREQCDKNGYRQDIQRGSFANEATHRLQSEPLMFEIFQPTNFIYLPRDVTPGMIENYYSTKVLCADKCTKEEYTYGERIMSQIEVVFEMLSGTPSTNQASISVSEPSDIDLPNPPCLREITFSYFNNRLHLTSFWRSNDVGEAFLMNQGGLGLLLQEASEYAGLEMGSHYYCSPGAHIYKR